MDWFRHSCLDNESVNMQATRKPRQGQRNRSRFGKTGRELAPKLLILQYVTNEPCRSADLTGNPGQTRPFEKIRGKGDTITSRLVTDH